jgi:hypothetical protein
MADQADIERKLQAIGQASAEYLGMAGRGRTLVAEALLAGATRQQIQAAIKTNPHWPVGWRRAHAG